MAETVGSRLVAAIAARDQDAIARCFAPDAELRALTPRGLRERTGRDEVAALVAGWFADSTTLAVVDSGEGQVADKLYLRYRVDGIEEGEPYVVEQHVYCVASDGEIERADLLCSGFRPRP